MKRCNNYLQVSSKKASLQIHLYQSIRIYQEAVFYFVYIFFPSLSVLLRPIKLDLTVFSFRINEIMTCSNDARNQRWCIEKMHWKTWDTKSPAAFSTTEKKNVYFHTSRKRARPPTVRVAFSYLKSRPRH